MILNVDFELKLSNFKKFYMSQMNPEKFLHNTTFSTSSLPLNDEIDLITVSKEDISCLLHMHAC